MKYILLILKSTLFNRVPILTWAPRYGSDKLISDAIAGITVGLTVMPQALAYATLAGLEPQVFILFRGHRSVARSLTFRYKQKAPVQSGVKDKSPLVDCFTRITVVNNKIPLTRKSPLFFRYSYESIYETTFVSRGIPNLNQTFYLQYGLYSAFVGCFVYTVFGTCKDITIGPTALMALMTYQQIVGRNTDYAILLCFLCGIVQLAMAILHLGI
jgi:hypothetical protein